jgi:hypothetical protein
MLYETAYRRNKEFIVFANEQDFEAHYNHKEKCVKNRYFLSHTYLPTTFPCAYEIKGYEYGGRFINSYDFVTEYLKPCSLYYAYYECTITLQQTIANLQNSLDNINAEFFAFGKMAEDE